MSLNNDPKPSEKPESEAESGSEGGEAPKKPRPEPTRYGDWEINGRCVDF